MNKHDNGFSFGVSGESADAAPASGEIDAEAIEVSTEPVTRQEAATMGIGEGEGEASTLGRKSTTGILRIDQLPKEIAPELARKLETAWAHLSKNEIAPALTLAQEIVWEYPHLTAPKLVIARCFINRKEYEKTLKLLGAIPENEMNAEVHYYIGLSQSRLGRLGEAMESLRLARASSQDAELRKRAGELLQRLQGEPVACPACGRKVLYDSMREVGDETVCADCAKKLEGGRGGWGGDGAPDGDAEEGGAGDAEWGGDDIAAARPRKRLRPPLTTGEIALRIALIPCLVVIAWVALYILSTAAPRHYASARAFLPDWTGLPEPQRMPLPPDPVLSVRAAAPQLFPAGRFASPPLARAVAFLELRHSAYIENGENRDWRYAVRIAPQPKGAFGMDPETGEFHWTPDGEDGGKIFEIIFTASRANHHPGEQLNRVAVSPGPRFTALADGAPPKPGEARRIATADLDGNGSQELIIASGAGGEGALAVFTLTGDTAPGASSRPRASMALQGEPAGMGVIRADDEPWVAVAGAGKPRIGYYAFRGGALSEMALEIALPGRPLLAAFDAESSVSAVLCQTGEGRTLAVHRQEGQLRSRKAGEWAVPGSLLWRRIVILPGTGGGASARARCILFGDDAEAALLFEEDAEEAAPLRAGLSGTLIDAAPGGAGEAFCLVRNDGGTELYRLAFDGAGVPVLDGPARAEGDVPSGRLVVVPGAVDGRALCCVLSGGSVALSLVSSGAAASPFHEWPLPRAAEPLGGTAVIPAADPADARVAYFDNAGSAWAFSLPAPSEP